MKGQQISVLYFTNSLVRAGAEEHILTLLQGLDRRHFCFHLVCPEEVAEALRPSLPADVELIALKLRKPTQVGAALQLMKVLRSRRVDILHSHLFYSSLFAAPIGWLCRVPVILETPHVAERWRRGWLKKRFVVDRLVGQFVDYYIAVSEANARYLMERKGLPSRKVVLIRNGCPLERFDPNWAAPVGMRQRLGFGPEDPVLAVLGRLEPQKGHWVLLEALAALRRKFPNVRLVCLGEGSLRSELERRAQQLGLVGSVRFVGYRSNVADWLAMADLTVLPSFYEGLPLVAIESLAAARPVVASAVDGTPEVIVDGKTGLTVPPGDARRLGEAIGRLLSNPQERRRLGHNGRQWVMEHFSQAQQIRRTQELYFYAWNKRVPQSVRGLQGPYQEARTTFSDMSNA